MRIFVNYASVEVFGNDGGVAITDYIFTGSESEGLEVYPLEVRGKGSAAGSFTHWVLDFGVFFTVLTLIGAITATGTFWLYGLFGLIGIMIPVSRGAGDQGPQPRRDRGGTRSKGARGRGGPTEDRDLESGRGIGP